MQVVAAAAMEPPGGRRPENAQGRDRVASSARSTTPIRPTTCAASTTATSTSTASRRTRPPRRTRRCGSRSTTGAGRACRSSSAPASGCRSRRPSCGSSSSIRRGSASVLNGPDARAEPARGQARPVDGHPAHRRRAPRGHRREPGRSRSTWSSQSRAARARRPTRCCCTPRWSATAPASPARTASRRPGGSCSRCSTRRRPCTRTRRDLGARRRPTTLVAGLRPLARAVDRIMRS